MTNPVQKEMSRRSLFRKAGAGAACLTAATLVPTETLEARPVQADFVLVEKARRTLFLYRDGVVLWTLPIGLGFSPVGTKVRRGDGRTPEGLYRITHRNAQSRFHLSLKINYPDHRDLARAEALQVDPGDNIFIHGEAESTSGRQRMAATRDWTDGCIALSDRDMNLLWSCVPIGTSIAIRA